MLELKPIKPKFYVGDICKCNSPAAYRLDDPFEIIGITIMTPRSCEPRFVYMIQFLGNDPEVDAIPIISEDEYEMELLKSWYDRK